MVSGATLLFLLSAQATPPPAPPSPRQETAQGAPSSPDEIVVLGIRDIDDPDAPVTEKTMNSQRPILSPSDSRTMLWHSQRFARCALRNRPNLDLLRKALDRPINSATQYAAQQRLVQSRSPCTENPTAVRFSGFGSERPATAAMPAQNLDREIATYYDRGALFIEAVKTFAPDLRLTRDDLADPKVLARFNTRETQLARFRLPGDKKYLTIAVCLVKQQPGLAVKLVQTDGPPVTIEKLAAAMVNRARPCVGGARRVYFDPMQFRFYMGEAVYRWAVAAKGVDSLIPAR